MPAPTIQEIVFFTLRSRRHILRQKGYYMYTQENGKKYTGTKTLTAWPATLGEYNEYRGWTQPTGESPTTPGYLVEYSDGGKANHPNHDGYISWSPADVFERTYHDVSDWKGRLVAEAGELSFRLDKLHDFVTANPAYEELSEIDQSLLYDQLDAMKTYLVALKMRLQRVGLG